MAEYNINKTPFRFWCQKVLPLVYDDSLSYYELLCKVVDYLNKAMEDLSTVTDEIQALYYYVDNYFENVDVTEEINAKLDSMAADGTLEALFGSYVDSAFVKLSDKIESQNSVIANQNTVLNTTSNEIDVLTERMNEFSSLTEGSTTGDAELADIRVAANGVTYANAGSAVRNMDISNSEAFESELGTEVQVIAKNVRAVTQPIESAKLILNTGEVVDVLDANPWFKVIRNIPVKYGQFISAAQLGCYGNNALYAFYDSEGTAIEIKTFETSGYHYEENAFIKVPLGAKYAALGIFYNVDNDDRAFRFYNVVESHITESKYRKEYIDAGSYEYLTPVRTLNCLIGHDKILFPYADYTVNKYDVEGYSFAYIKDYTNFSNTRYLIVDASEQIIDYEFKVSGDSSVKDTKIRIPDGAKYIYVSNYQNNEIICGVTNTILTSDVKYDNKKWACIGDSLTAENTRATKRYFDYIAEDTGIVPVNLGVGGTGYMKGYDTNEAFYQRTGSIPMDSDVITIFGSGNDLSLPLGTVTDTGTSTICGCFNTTIDNIRNRITGANIGVITPTPWDGYNTMNVGNAMDNYANAIVEMCKRKGVPCLDLYHCSNMLPWSEAFRTKYYKRDDGNGVHPDEDGQKFFASHIKAFIGTLLM